MEVEEVEASAVEVVDGVLVVEVAAEAEVAMKVHPIWWLVSAFLRMKYPRNQERIFSKSNGIFSVCLCHGLCCIEVGAMMHECESEMVCKLIEKENKIPHFNAGIYLENKKKVGKVDEVRKRDIRLDTLTFSFS